MEDNQHCIARIERDQRIAENTPALEGNEYVARNEWGLAYRDDVSALLNERRVLVGLFNAVAKWVRGDIDDEGLEASYRATLSRSVEGDTP